MNVWGTTATGVVSRDVSTVPATVAPAAPFATRLWLHVIVSGPAAMAVAAVSVRILPVASTTAEARCSTLQLPLHSSLLMVHIGAESKFGFVVDAVQTPELAQLKLTHSGFAPHGAPSWSSGAAHAIAPLPEAHGVMPQPPTQVPVTHCEPDVHAEPVDSDPVGVTAKEGAAAVSEILMLSAGGATFSESVVVSVKTMLDGIFPASYVDRVIAGGPDTALAEVEVVAHATSAAVIIAVRIATEVAKKRRPRLAPRRRVSNS